MSDKKLSVSLTLAAADKASSVVKRLRGGMELLGGQTGQVSAKLNQLGRTQKLAKGFRALNEQTGKTSDRLAAAQAKTAQLGKAMKGVEKPSNKLQKEFAQSRSVVAKLQKAQQSERADLQKLRGKLGEAGFDTRRFGNEFNQLGRDIKKTSDKLARFQNLAHRKNKLGQSLGRLRQQGTRAGAGIGVAFAAAVGGVFGLAKTTADAGDDAAKTAKKIGVLSTELQELRYAGERSGMGTEELDKSLEKYVKGLGEAVQGIGSARYAYDALGLSSSKLAKLSPAESLNTVADKLAGIDNHARKAAIANQLFGRSGLGMIEVLRGGSKGLDALRGEARRTGYVLSEQAAVQGETFTDSLLNAETSAKGLGRTLGSKLLPVFTRVFNRFGHWVQNNAGDVDQLSNRLAAFVTDGVPKILEAGIAFGKLAASLGRGINKVADLVGGFDHLAALIGGLVLSKFIVSLGSVVFQLGAGAVAVGKLAASAGLLAPLGSAMAGIGIKVAALGKVFLASPMGLVVASLAAAGYLLWSNWDTVSTHLAAAWDKIQGLFSAGKDFISDALTRTVSTLTGFGETLSTGFQLAWSASAHFLKGLPGTVAGYFSELATRAVGALAGFGGTLSTGFQLAWSASAHFLKGLPGTVTGYFSELATRAVGALAGFGGTLSTGFQLAWSASAHFLKGLPGTVAGYFSALVTRAVGALAGLGESLAGALARLPGRFANLGGLIVEGIAKGITEAKNAAVKKLQDVGNGLVGGFKSLLGIKSPSRVFIEHGGQIIEGLRQGIGHGERPVSEAMKKLTAGILTASALATPPALAHPPMVQPQTLVNPAAHSQGQRTTGDIHINITVQVDSRADARQIGLQTARAVTGAVESLRGGALYDEDI